MIKLTHAEGYTASSALRLAATQYQIDADGYRKNEYMAPEVKIRLVQQFERQRDHALALAAKIDEMFYGR